MPRKRPINKLSRTESNLAGLRKRAKKRNKNRGLSANQGLQFEGLEDKNLLAADVMFTNVIDDVGLDTIAGVSDSLTNDANPEFVGIVTDSGTPISGETVVFTANGSEIGSAVTDGSGEFSFTPDAANTLPEGAVEIVATVGGATPDDATDDGSASFDLIIDTTAADAPAVTGFDFDGDFLSGVAEANATVTVGSLTTTADGDGLFTIDVTDELGAFPDVLLVTQTDAAGNTSLATTVALAQVTEGSVAIDGTTVNQFALTGEPGSTASELSTDGLAGSVTVAADGVTASYDTPDADFFGQEEFEFVVTDGDGVEAPGIAFIDVLNVNDAPTVTVDPNVFTAVESATGGPVAFLNAAEFLPGPANESDQGLAGFTVVQTGGDIDFLAGLPVFSDLPGVFFGALAIDLLPNASGTATFTVIAQDDGGTANGGVDTSAAVGFTVVVTPVNNAPEANADTFTPDEGIDFSGDVSINDDDIDGDALTISLVSGPDNGSLIFNSDGTFTYNSGDFFGTTTFTYQVSDGSLTDTATVTLNVASINDDPIAVADVATTDEDVMIEIDVLANDSDVEDENVDLIVSAVTQPVTGGSVAIAADDGSVIFTPDSDFSGEVEFTYTVQDTEGGTDTATVTVTVNAIDDGVDAVDDDFSGDEQTVITGNVLDNDSDPEGEPLSATFVEGSLTGGDLADLTFNSDGSFSFNAGAINDGIDQVVTFQYTASDNNPDSADDVATVTITINAVNNGPSVSVPGDQATVEDTPFTIPAITVSDPDADGGDLEVDVVLTGDGVGQLEIDGTVGTAFTLTGTISELNTLLAAVGYIPGGDLSGTDTVTVTVDDLGNSGDGGPLEASDSFDIAVGAVNDAPIAADDSAEVLEDGGVIIDVLFNDNDTEDAVDDLTVAIASDPANGSVTVNDDGTITYLPDSNFFGEDTFTYTITDSAGDSATATVTVTVQPVNDDPIAVDDVISDIDEDPESPVTLDVLANDSAGPNEDGQTLEIVGLGSLPAGVGTVEISEDGSSLIFTPAENFFGTFSFDYTIRDNGQTFDVGSGGLVDAFLEDTATVTVTVNPVNDDPVAADDSATTAEDTPVMIDVLDNDFDVEDDAEDLTITIGSTENGSAVVVDGQVEFTPDADFFGEATFTYTVTDSDGGVSNTATVTIDVTPVNDAPTVDNPLFANPSEGDSPFTIDLLTGADDVDGGALSAGPISVTIDGDPAMGTPGFITLAGDDLTFNPSYPFFDDLNVGETREVVVSYDISDGAGGTVSQTLTVTVSGTNDAPVDISGINVSPFDTEVNENTGEAEPDSLSLTFGEVRGLIGGAVLDVDNSNDELTVTFIVGSNAPVVFTIAEILDPANADGDELIGFTPDLNFNGTVPVSVSLDDPFTGSTLIFDITVNPVNTAPEIVSSSVSIAEDTSLTFNLQDIVSDVETADGDLVFAFVSAEGVDEEGVPGPFGDNPVVSPDGQVTFTPADGFVGFVNLGFSVTDDGDGTAAAETSPGNLLIVVSPANDAPEISIDSDLTTPEDTEITLTGIEVTDVDAEDEDLSVTVSVDVGSLTLGSDSGSTLNFDGTLAEINTALNSIEFSPALNFNGDATVTIYVNDNGNTGAGGPLTAHAELIIDVTPVNDAPTGGDDFFGTDEDTELSVPADGVLGNDVDVDGDAFGLYAADGVLGGGGDTLFGSDSSVAITTVNGGSVTLNDDGSFVYTPAANFNGEDSFQYSLIDENGEISDPVTVTIDVAPVNDAPDAVDDGPFTVLEGGGDFGTVTIDVLDNDFDDGDALDPSSVTIVTEPENGTAVVNADGTITFTSDADDFFGEVTFEYTVADLAGAVSAPATVTVQVVNVNDDPVANNDTFDAVEDTTLEVDASGVLGNDTDVEDDGLIAIIITGASNGDVTLNFDGGFTYVPNADFSGVDSFTYQVVDDDGGVSNIATVTINVAAVNDAPEAEGLTDTIDEDTVFTIDLNGLVTDVDGDDLSFSIEDGDGPANGAIAIDEDGVLTYTPDADFNGEDSFVYTVDDGNGGTDSATISLIIAPVADAPTAVDDLVETVEDSLPVTFNVLDNDFDPDGDTISFVGFDGGSIPGLVSTGGGGFTFAPEPDFFGDLTFTYEISDGDASTANSTGTVTISVEGVNDAPVAIEPATFAVAEDQVLTGTLEGFDIDGDDLTFSVGGDPDDQPENGTLVLDPATGEFTYTPDADFFGLETFTFFVSDGELSSEEVTVTINVLPVNDAPVAEDDTATTNEDTPVFIDVLANDNDVDDADGDLTISLDNPVNGSAVVDGDGQVLFTPDENFFGEASFTYTLTDPAGLESNTATVTITVVPVEDPTSAGDVVLDDIDEDTSLSFTAEDLLANSSDVDSDLTVENVAVSSGSGTITGDAENGFVFTPDANFNGPVVLVYDVVGSDTIAVEATFNVDAVNDAPVINTVDFDPNVTEGGFLLLSDLFNVSDIDINEGEDPGVLTVTVTVPDGFSFDSEVYSLDVTGNTLTIEDEIGAVNTILGGVTIEVDDVDPGSSDSVDFEITVTADDNGGTGSGVGTDSATFDVVGFDGAPTVSLSITSPADFDGTIDEGTPFTLTIDELFDPAGSDDPITAATVFLVDGSEIDLNDSQLATLNSTGEVSVGFVIDDDVDQVNDFITVTLFSEGNANGFENAGGPLDVEVLDVAPSGLLALSGTFDEGSTGAQAVVQELSDPSFDDFASLTVTFDFDGDGVADATADPAGAPVDIPAEFLVAPGITVTATITDNDGVTTVLTDTVDVNNLDPVANDDAFEINQDTVLDVAAPGLLVNDTDATPLTVNTTPVSGPANGVLVLNADGSFTYTPTAGFSGTDSFVYQVEDGNGGIDTAEVVITVNDTVAPTVESVVINDGSAQRSRVESLTVTFSEIVNGVDAAAFVLTNTTTGVAVDGVNVALSEVDGQTVATLTFSGAGTDFGSLADGDYTLLAQSSIQDAGGNSLVESTFNFHRFFGDVNGDRSLNFIDLPAFSSAFDSAFGDENFVDELDFNDDGFVNFIDLVAYSSRFNTGLDD